LSDKNKNFRTIIRIRLCIEAVNFSIVNNCTYFIDKCNESKIFFKDDCLIFNMLNFILEKESRRVGGIFMALTHSGRGRP